MTMLGLKHSPEAIQKIRESNRGKHNFKHSLEAKIKIGEATTRRCKGQPSPFRGKTYQEIGRSPSPLTGRERSQEDKIKISKGHLKRFGDLPPSGERDASLSRQWTTAVKKRDNYTCQGCGIHQKEIPWTGNCVKDRVHAHHIKSWKKFPELRFDVSNGVTLCHSCHVSEENKRTF